MRHGESLQRTEQEIRQAKAEALGRAGERLEAALARLAAMDRDLDQLAGAGGAGPVPGREEQVSRETTARDRLREEALRLRHALVIQREAVGLRRHTSVEERYPIPPRRSAGPASSGA
jgi:hypothetical protein